MSASSNDTVRLAVRQSMTDSRHKRVEYPCLAVGNFSVLRTLTWEGQDKKSWQVSHTRTGYAAVTFLKRKRDAVAFAAWLDSQADEWGIDWAGLKNAKDMTKLPKYEAICAAVRARKNELDYANAY